jgi:hypothetical protein
MTSNGRAVLQWLRAPNVQGNRRPMDGRPPARRPKPAESV